jgi:ABC-type multidrug transport system permease subunit
MFETWLSTFGQLIAGIAPTQQAASQLIPMFFVFVVLFCGVLQPYSKIPEFWHFVHFASPFTWLIGYIPLPFQLLISHRSLDI